MEKLFIFEVVKPQGIKGELKVKTYVDSFSSVSGIKTIYTENGNEYKVSYLKNVGDGYAFIKLDSVNDRNTAELMRNYKFFALKTSIKKDKNSYFIEDLLGFKVYSNEYVGVLVDVIKSNVDMFVVENDNKVVYVPFLKKLNPIINLENKTITFSEENFKELAYYES